MRLAWAAGALLFAGFVLFAGADVGAIVAVGGFALLPVLGYRSPSWHGLAWAAIVPAAAVAADIVTFTPLSLQPETDVIFYTPLALVYLPVWVLFVAIGIGARRLRRPTAAAG